MAELKEKRIQPAQEFESTVGLQCDVCGAKTDSDEFWPRLGEARRSDYGGLIQTVTSTDTNRYPEGGSERGDAWDLCPKCFDEHIRKPLIALGAQPRKIDMDW